MKLYITKEVIEKSNHSYPLWEDIKGKDVASVKEIFSDYSSWNSALDVTSYSKSNNRCVEFTSSKKRALVFFINDVAVDYYIINL